LLPCSAQRLRQGQTDRTALSKKAAEFHFYSNHPNIPTDRSKAVFGTSLLDQAIARKDRLKARIQATRTAHPHPLNAPTGFFPGIQFRGSLPAGSIANAVVTGDFNNDGKPDIVLGNYAKGFMFQQGLIPFWAPNLPFIVLENHIKK